MEDGDPIVALAREINPRFEYPVVLEEVQSYLREHTRKRQKRPRRNSSRRGSSGSDGVEIDVRFTDGGELTTQQLDYLKRLATLYHRRRS
ncbi:MAG TPA: hypothetical protein VJB06_03340 [archaeon]|nr:hypothetical protein [archaeon]